MFLLGIFSKTYFTVTTIYNQTKEKTHELQTIGVLVRVVNYSRQFVNQSVCVFSTVGHIFGRPTENMTNC